jgi:Cu(I)/Ag(I) efflux system membrane protein CusA/SilA
MPPLYEGSLLYMPTGLPAMSITQAQRALQLEDKIIKQFPEVQSVFGKAGRSTTSTDPAPIEMSESTIVLKPESEWPAGMTSEKFMNQMDAALKIPGIANSWTMPIKGRIDMLSTGIRTPIGIKILGPDFTTIQDIGKQLEDALRDLPGTRNIYAERVASGYFLDFKVDRDAIARYGLKVADVEDAVETARDPLCRSVFPRLYPDDQESGTPLSASRTSQLTVPAGMKCSRRATALP